MINEEPIKLVMNRARPFLSLALLAAPLWLAARPAPASAEEREGRPTPAAAAPASRPAAHAAPAPAAAKPAQSDPESPSPDRATRAKQMARWFADLASADAGMRESARVSLMSLGRNDVPAFRDLVRDHRPLLPSQAVVLKEIVTQMYLSGDAYDTAGHDGFLGIRPAAVAVGVLKPDPADNANDHKGPEAAQPGPGGGVGGPGAQIRAQPPIQIAGQFPGGAWDFPDPNALYGIAVMERMPGFTGARSLQDGDVILGIVERPEVKLTDAPEFSLAVRALGAGTRAHFVVLRQGQVVRVGVKLDARPDAAESSVQGPSPMQKLLDDRKKAVDDLWEQQFAPLLEEGVG